MEDNREIFKSYLKKIVLKKWFVDLTPENRIQCINDIRNIFDQQREIIDSLKKGVKET